MENYLPVIKTITISVIPLKGKTSRWKAICSACGPVGIEINKREGERCAQKHADENHLNQARIRSHR